MVAGETRTNPSGLDGVVVLDTPIVECLRRAENRKLDPQTNIVYHMEDNPHNDPKIEERLKERKDESISQKISQLE